MDDWYKSSKEEIQLYGGSRILSHHNHSLLETLKFVYPQHEWLEWKFHSVPKKYWEDANNQRKFIDWLGTQLGYKSMEDWYKVTIEMISEHGGKGLLNHYYGNSASHMIQTLYSTYEWIPWKFIQVPNGYWEDSSHQMRYLNWLGEQLGYKSMEDWYNLNVELIQQHHGIGLLNKYYNGSPIQLLQTLYPTYDWIPWKFRVSNGYWEDPNNQRRFVEWLGQQLGYKSLEDWYNITLEQIFKYGGRGLLAQFHDSPIQMLQTLYPSYDWIPWRFIRKPKSQAEDERKFINWIVSQEFGFKSDSKMDNLQKKIYLKENYTLMSRPKASRSGLCSIKHGV